MEFLKLEDLSLNAAGYLVSKKSQKPVTNDAFVAEQATAEYVVKLAAAIKDKTFTVNKIDDLEAIKASVKASMSNGTKSYVSEPSKPISKINDELVKFALDFNNYEDDKVKTGKLNEFMNQFNKIDDVEQVGEYFKEGITKLGGLYDIKTILQAAEINVSKLNN